MLQLKPGISGFTKNMVIDRPRRVKYHFKYVVTCNPGSIIPYSKDDITRSLLTLRTVTDPV